SAVIHDAVSIFLSMTRAHKIHPPQGGVCGVSFCAPIRPASPATITIVSSTNPIVFVIVVSPALVEVQFPRARSAPRAAPPAAAVRAWLPRDPGELRV